MWRLFVLAQLVSVVRSQPSAAELQDFLRFVNARLPNDSTPANQQWMTQTRGVQIEQYPGLNQAQVIPFMARQMPMGFGKGFVVGTATKELAPPPQAFEEVRLGNGRITRVPKGFYSAKDKQEERDAYLNLPNLRDPLSLIAKGLGGKMQNSERNAQTDGVYLPMPFGIDPINIQLLKDNSRSVHVNGGLGLTNAQKQQGNMQIDDNVAMRVLDNFADALQRQQRRNGAISREILAYCSSVPREMCRQALQQQQNDDVGTRLVSNLSKIVLPHMKHLFTKGSKKEEAKKSTPTIASMFDRLFSVQKDESIQAATGAYIGLPFLPDLYLGVHEQ